VSDPPLHRCQCCHVDNGRAAVASANRIHRQPKGGKKNYENAAVLFWEEGGDVVRRLREGGRGVSWQPLFLAACSSPKMGRKWTSISCSRSSPQLLSSSTVDCSLVVIQRHQSLRRHFGDPAGRRKADPAVTKKNGFS